MVLVYPVAFWNPVSQGSGDAFSYLRIVNTVAATGTDAQWICYEVDFIGDNGASLASGGAPLDTVIGGSSANCFDGIVSSMSGFVTLADNDTPIGYVGYNFPSPVIHYAVRIANLNNDPNNIPPTTYKVQGSQNGIEWIDMYSFSTGTLNAVYYIGFNDSNPEIPNKYYYWRITNTVAATGSDAQWICYEIRFLDSFNVLLIQKGQAYGINVANLENAFDGNFGTFASITDKTTKIFNSIGYRFAYPSKPDKLEIRNLNNGFNVPPTSYMLQKSNNGTDWIDHQSFTIGSQDGTAYFVNIDP